MLKALKNRSIALLWIGQAASAIGDEIYRVALIWIAVGLIGEKSGYLAAGQSAALFLMSLLAGKWADRWDHFKTMIWIDCLRAVLVLIPVIYMIFSPLSMSLLWVVALLISGLSAFFDPAVQALTPRYCEDTKALKAANGLMATTIRLARVAGPGLIGVFALLMPAIHFFSLDAATFLISAFSLIMLRRSFAQRGVDSEPKPVHLGYFDSVLSGFRELKNRPRLQYTMIAKGVTSGAWNLTYGLGFALLAHKIAPSDVRALGSIVGAYGIGNLGAALILGNMPRKRTNLIMFCGYMWLGFGFMLVGLAPNLPMLMVAAGFAAIGGPMNDIAFIDAIQTSFPIGAIPKMFRLRIALEMGVTLVTMALSPLILSIISVQTTIILAGLLTLLMGGWGVIKYGEKNTSEVSAH